MFHKQIGKTTICPSLYPKKNLGKTLKLSPAPVHICFTSAPSTPPPPQPKKKEQEKSNNVLPYHTCSLTTLFSSIQHLNVPSWEWLVISNNVSTQSSNWLLVTASTSYLKHSTLKASYYKNNPFYYLKKILIYKNTKEKRDYKLFKTIDKILEYLRTIKWAPHSRTTARTKLVYNHSNTINK